MDAYGVIMIECAWEDIFFMCDLNYTDIITKYELMLKYCLKFSDTFSVITDLKKPFSKIPPICKHDNTLNLWSSCLSNQIIGIKKWPGTETKDNHKVMNIYNSRKFRTTISDIPNLFSPIINNLPEDICFYRGTIAWFVTVSHERLAFMNTPTKEDILFLKQNEIECYYNEVL